MADYTVQGNRLLPLHNVNPNANAPHSSIQSITMGIRIGNQKFAIGYINKWSFNMERSEKVVFQIEPYPDVRGDDSSAAGIASVYTARTFDENTTYWPGEAIEIIPGKMNPIKITLHRYALYTGNLLAAVSRATGSGVYDSAEVPPNIQETEAPVIKYVNILQQVRPFDIYQIFVSPRQEEFCGGGSSEDAGSLKLVRLHQIVIKMNLSLKKEKLLQHTSDLSHPRLDSNTSTSAALNT